MSIIMPVYNTGQLLVDSVRSVVAQTLFAEERDGYWELLLVDDASNNPETQVALEAAAALSPSIHVLSNRHVKGAAGARNTGIFAAQGEWIAFLDSDDLWYPDFLRRQRNAFIAMPAARWRAAHFQVGDEAAHSVPSPLSSRSPCLYREIRFDYVAGRITVLRHPVNLLLSCGCLQVMTVQVRRDLIQAVGGFDESFAYAEDYDLWLRLACVEDLAIAPIDAGVYRVRSGSLTKSGRPMYFGEDRMLKTRKADPAFNGFHHALDARLAKVYTKFCFHFREHRRFADAIVFASRLIRLAPTKADGWRHLVAAALRR